MANPNLKYRAGPKALHTLRHRGLRPETLGALVGPASGPRWLTLAGLDRALHESGLLDKDIRSEPAPRILLAGTSAGAWRMAALASRDPMATHQRLQQGYVEQLFDRRDTPRTVTDAYRRMLTRVFSQEDIAHILSHPRCDLAMHAARSRRGLDILPERLRALAMVKASLLTGLSYRGAGLLVDRVLLCSAPRRFPNPFPGSLAPLDRQNFQAAALATASMPIYLEPQWHIPGVPAGPCYDGGITDYQLRQAYLPASEHPDRLVLMPHYQGKIERAWWAPPFLARSPTPELLDNILLMHPSEEFLASLPAGRLPDVGDFKRFVDDPGERIRRWYEVSARSQQLGEQFLADLASGALVDQVEAL